MRSTECPLSVHPSSETRQVTSLRLSFVGLNGSIPTSIGFLTGLKELLMTENTIHGELPAVICQCTLLETMELSRNRI